MVYLKDFIKTKICSLYLPKKGADQLHSETDQPKKPKGDNMISIVFHQIYAYAISYSDSLLSKQLSSEDPILKHSPVSNISKVEVPRIEFATS